MPNSPTNPFIFITLVTVIVSLLLSIASTQLKSFQNFNIEVDKKKNVLKSVGLNVAIMSSNDIIKEYKNRINETIVNTIGETVNDIKLSDLVINENKATGQTLYRFKDKDYLPLFISNSPEAIIIPISGKGLWSTLYGYFALDTDLNTSKGITFYKHKETPGLGGEVEKNWFQNNFIGKKILDVKGNFVSIAVLKGKSNDNIHGVDGISGATITSRGVTTFLKNDLQRYLPYFKRKSQSGS